MRAAFSQKLMISSLRSGAPAGGHNRLAGWLLAIACLIVLGGCAAGQQPFAKSVGAPPAADGAAGWPRVTVDSFSGLPDGKDALFLQALAAEAYRRQIALVNSPPGQGIYAISGSVSARDVDGRTAVSWTWEVKGWDGAGSTTISGQEFVPQPKGEAPRQPADTAADGWGKVDDFMLRRVAMHLSESLSGFFGEQGYLTQTAGLPPPVETFVRAGPGAEKDVDLSMLGPNELALRRERGEVSESDLAALGLDLTPAPVDEPQAAQQQAEPEKPSRPKTPGQKEITSVAVASVTGAPGNGNSALAASLRKVLRGAGWPIKDKPGENTLLIKGQVGVAPPSGGVQQVSLEWTVQDPTGRTLGAIKQANQVPAGSLDGSWGLTADYAAEAAALGIFDLVGKLR